MAEYCRPSRCVVNIRIEAVRGRPYRMWHRARPGFSGCVHFAAGLAICGVAGCTVTDLRGQPWGYAATGLVAAADPDTHAALLRLVKKYL
jgi:hypothetical protein